MAQFVPEPMKAPALELKLGSPTSSAFQDEALQDEQIIPASTVIERSDLQEALHRQPAGERPQVVHLHSARTLQRYLLARWERDGTTRLFGPLPDDGADWIPVAETVESDLVITGELQASG